MVVSFEVCLLTDMCICSVPHTSKFDKKNHCLVRNNLILQLILANCHRSGCILNMMVTNFEDAKSHNGCRVVRIKDHKTAKIYGSAEVIIAQDVYKNMLTYLNH